MKQAETVPEEVALWRAVIAQALADARIAPIADGRRRSDELSPPQIRHRDRARAWLLGRSRDFGLVCNLALLEPAAVYDAARDLAAAGWPRDDRGDQRA